VKIVVALVVLALSMGFAGRAPAAPPHTISWTARSAAPGAVVTLGGQQFVLARIPVRDLGGSRRFSVSFLTPKTGAVSPAILTTVHNRDPLNNPIEIDGFDASVTITDGRTYSILNNFVSPGDYTFTVAAHASCSVSLKLGQTLLTLIGHIQVVQQDATDIGNKPNAVPHAEWTDWVHPTAQVTACNNWIDYIRVQEL
jgi:hypothetical protein